MVTYLGSLVQLLCGEGGTLQTNITGVCGESSECLGHTGFAPLAVCVLSWCTLLRLQVALHGNCLKWTLSCVHFPGLSHSGSGSQVLHKGTDSVGLAFCTLPRSKKLRRPGVWRMHRPGGLCVLITSLVPATGFPGWAGKAPPKVCRVSPLGS